MKRDRIVTILLKVNIARRISDHLLGQEHPMKHRMWVGSMLMLIGVTIAHSPLGYFSVITDLVGYAIHGAGTIPFIDWLTKRKIEAEGREKEPSHNYKTRGHIGEEIHG